jgi:phosphatidylserine decarboxylase
MRSSIRSMIDTLAKNLKTKLMGGVMAVLPKEDMSTWVGKLVHQKLPKPLRKVSIQAFANAFSIDISEGEFPIDAYESIGDFFSRRLKAGARPLGQGFLHCADAVISQAGKISNDSLVQAKGINYSVAGLIRNPTIAQSLEGGSFATYYLCPTDYHRVHAPVSGRVIWSTHIPGALWPVNSWSVSNVEQVFERNERVAWLIETDAGHRVAMVMVAATNVGNISLSFDESITTADHAASRAVRERSYEPAVEIKAGDELGIFHMGSTVVLLVDSSFAESADKLRRQMGQATRVRASAGF